MNREVKISYLELKQEISERGMLWLQLQELDKFTDLTMVEEIKNKKLSMNVVNKNWYNLNIFFFLHFLVHYVRL